MKTKLQLLGILPLLISGAYGLEFGTMGNVSASMGGAGVALKQSAWGLYYNPALLGADNRAKMALSFGASYKEQNLITLTNIDINNLSNLTQTLDQKLLGGVAGGAVTVDGGKTIDGILGNTLAAMIGGNTLDGTTLKNWAETKIGMTGVTDTDLKTAAENIATAAQNNTTFQTKIKDSLSTAVGQAGGSPLLQAIIDGIDVNNMGKIIEQVGTSGADFNIEELLTAVGTITIARGADSEIDKFLDDYTTLQKALDVNDASVRSQNGLVVQIAGDKKRGAIAFGILPQVFLNANATMDPTHKDIIIKTGSGTNAKYLQANISDSGIGFTNIGIDGETKYNNSSILSPNARHRLQTTMLSVIEVPIGYGHSLDSKIGEFNLGGALKYMHGIGYRLDEYVNLDKTTINFNSDQIKHTSNFGIDLGVLWTPGKHKSLRKFDKKLHVGLVAKNINSPKMKVNDNDSVKINPQLRAGVSYEAFKYLTLALDADLMPNNTLSMVSPKSQTIGGGILSDFHYIDFRLGMLKDIKSKSGEGFIATGGLNLLGFLDLSVQYGLGKSVKLFNDTKLSNYVDVKLGMQFSW